MPARLKTTTFVIAAFLALATQIVFYRSRFRENRDKLLEDKTLKIALNVSGTNGLLDPQRVLSTVDAQLAQNLYSRLVSLDDDGQLSGDLASDFIWNGRSFVFTLRDLQTIDGYKIDAEDVYFSLLRIIRNNDATHGNLRDFLCERFDRAADVSCNGLEIVDGKIVLTPTDISKRAFLISLLASVDMSIIPKRAIDFTKPAWDIIDFRQTTGLYYLKDLRTAGAATWEINPFHYRFDKNHFSRVEIVPTKSGPDSFKAILNGAVDMVPTAAGLKNSDVDQLRGGFSIHSTYPIKLIAASFTTKGHKLSLDDRLSIAAGIKDVLHKSQGFTHHLGVSEIFPPQSEGMLDKLRLSQYEDLLNSFKSRSPRRRVHLQVGTSLYAELKDALSQLPWLKVECVNRLPFLDPIEDQPDLTIFSGDTSFYESVTMIHYYFAVGAFGSESEGMKWLEHYMTIGEKSGRIPLLRDLHLKLLLNADVVPLYLTEYYAVARKPIRMEMSKYFTGTPLWKVYQN